MPDCVDLKRDLEIVYRYFSHYIRTCTSVVVAMLDVVAEGLTDESMTSMIMESGYLLDIYDRGMSVCFSHVLEKDRATDQEKLDIAQIIRLFTKNAVSAESGVAVVSDISSLTAVCDAYSFKSLFQIMLQEGVASAAKELSLSFQGSTLSISPDSGFNEIQPIFRIFAEIFAETGIVMTYDKNKIDLRFNDESIDR